ncbi:MAG: glycosyltransferase [Oscillospiraceae bacterium]
MNILFTAFINPHAQSGVEKKILGQIKALEQLGNEVWYFTFENGMLTVNHSGKQHPLFPVKDSMASYYLALEKGSRMICRSRDLDLAYIRRIFCTPMHLKTLHMLRAKGVFLVEELPTYPYDGESANYKQLSYRVTAVVDKLCRGGFKRYLDYFVTYSQDKTIFGVPTICLENAIDFDNIQFRPTVFPKKEINLVGVSAMCPWHGYERVIKGLARYYERPRKIQVNLHLVGQGPEKAGWEELTAALGLERYVTFYGHKTGEELNAIFDKCQVGVGSLGFYKIGLTAGSPLKTREYAAMGKPFIYAMEDRSVAQVAGFCLKVDNCDAAINIETVVKFYDGIRLEQGLCERLNKFAVKNYSWETQMEKVLEAVVPQD